ncbi:UNVERIFIED_CONTAM: hypothetical protein FKN15_063833 [Acipenser sinensis]
MGPSEPAPRETVPPEPPQAASKAAFFPSLNSPSRGPEGLRPQTHPYTQHHLHYWRNCTSDSWVLATIYTGYGLQFHSGPPPFRGITVTSVNNPLQVLALKRVQLVLCQKLLGLMATASSAIQLELLHMCPLQKCPVLNVSVPHLINTEGHILYNLTGYSVEKYLLRTSSRFVNKSLCPPWLRDLTVTDLYALYIHSGITLNSHPYGGAMLDEDRIQESIRQCGVAQCILLRSSVVTASIATSVVKDRVSRGKQLQHILGVSYTTYWFANFLYDMEYTA